jgi:hypothetical protein
MTKRACLKELIPSLYNALTHWEQGYEEKHAYEFTSEQLIRYHSTAPDDSEGLLNKCYSSMATAFAARSADPIKLMRNHVTLTVDPRTNAKQFIIEYTRSKQRGKMKRTDTHALVTGQLEVDAIEKYIRCFKPLNSKDDGKDKRFFCYIKKKKM